MKTRHKRLLLIAAGLVILGLVAALVLNAFRSNLVFFFSPTQVATGEAPKGKAFRIGGIKMISACAACKIGARCGLAVCQRTADQFLRTCPVQSHAAL